MGSSRRRSGKAVGRLRVRPVFVYLFALAAGLSLASSLLPDADERAQDEVRTALARRAAIADPAERRRLVALLPVLKHQGDERRLERLSRLLLNSDPSPEELKSLVDDVSEDLPSWGTRIPAWEQDVVNAWLKRAGPASAGGALSRLFADAPVTLTFRSATRRRRLYIAGNWDGSGQLANLDGWAYVPMRDDGTHGDAKAGDGVWSASRRLRLTMHRNLYHAVVRTAPWPEGRALGHLDFAVAGAAEVEVPPVEASAERSQAAETATGSPALQLSVIGFDGATWRAVMPLVHQGLLPSFSRLVRDGHLWTTAAGAELASLPNIYSALTGDIIARHGLGKGYFGFNTARRSAPLWLAASQGHRSSTVVSQWSTMPPDEIDGRMVSEAFFALEAYRDPAIKQISLSPEVSFFAGRFGVKPEQIRRLLRLIGWIDGLIATTFPASLASDLRRNVPFPRISASSGLTGLSRLLDEQVVRATEYLIKRGPSDLLCVYLADTDHASHEYWFGFEPSLYPASPAIRDAKVRSATLEWRRRSRREFLDAYERADRLLGFLMDHSRRVIVYSDHGSGPYEHDFISLNLDIPKLVRAFARDAGLPAPEGVEFYHDHERWRVWLPKTGAESASVGRALERYVKAAAYLPSGQKMFSDVSLTTADGRLLLGMVQEQPRPHYVNAVVAGGRKRSVLDLMDLEISQGTHKRDGLLAVWGHGIRPGLEQQPVPLVDVAPTALYMLGLPVADDMDGVVLGRAFPAGTLAAHPARSIPTYGSGGSGYRRLAAAIQWRKAFRRAAAAIAGRRAMR